MLDSKIAMTKPTELIHRAGTRGPNTSSVAFHRRANVQGL